MVGVFARKWVEPLAEALRELGSEKAWVVHGSDGMDEITTTGPTFVSELSNGTIRSFEISPEDVGLAVSDPKDLKGGLPSENAKALRDVLAGAQNAYRDVVLFNAAASLLVADKVQTLKDGVEMAAQSIDSGSAADTLEKLVAASNG
jgi:anthranilate phosphoribosyltransferase